MAITKSNLRLRWRNAEMQHDIQAAFQTLRTAAREIRGWAEKTRDHDLRYERIALARELDRTADDLLGNNNWLINVPI